jgi:hypothetical protein
VFDTYTLASATNRVLKYTNISSSVHHKDVFFNARFDMFRYLILAGRAGSRTFAISNRGGLISIQNPWLQAIKSAPLPSLARFPIAGRLRSTISLWRTWYHCVGSLRFVESSLSFESNFSQWEVNHYMAHELAALYKDAAGDSGIAAPLQLPVEAQRQ